MTRAQRRTQLVAIAHETFGELGYRATSMADIAGRAGVTKPVLYQHFSGKLVLYRALLDQAVDDMVRAVRSAVRSRATNEDRVNAAVRCYFDVVCEPGGAGRLLLGDTRSFPEAAAASDRATAACVEVITEVVDENTELTAPEARLVAAGLVGLSKSAARHWLEVGRPERAEVVAMLSRLAWQGIGGFPSPGEPAG